MLHWLCREDIAAVSGQFWAEVITLCPLITHSQNSPVDRVMKKIWNTFHEGALTIVFFCDFASIALNLRKLAHLFWVSIHFHPYHLLQQKAGSSFDSMPKYSLDPASCPGQFALSELPDEAWNRWRYIRNYRGRLGTRLVWTIILGIQFNSCGKYFSFWRRQQLPWHSLFKLGE